MDYILICVHGCGMAGSDVETYQDKDALKDGDKSLYCSECNCSEWYVIPKEGG